MYPILFYFQGRPFSVWFLFAWIGALSGFFAIQKTLTQSPSNPQGLKSSEVNTLFFGAVTSWFVGAHLFDWISVGGELVSTSGYVLFGGVSGIFIWGILAWVGMGLFRRISLQELFDSASFAMAWAMMFGRMGCFFYGCCYGSPTGNSWGYLLNWEKWDHQALSFPQALLGLRLHPAPLYESFVFLLCILFYPWFLRLSQRYSHIFSLGMYGICTWMVYSIARLLIEEVRMDFRGQLYWGYTVSQLISWFFIGLGTFLFLYSRTPWGRFLILKRNLRLNIQ